MLDCSEQLLALSKGLVSGVWGLEFRVEGLGFRV